MQVSQLQMLIPKAEDLLGMAEQELAPILLKLAYDKRQNAGFVPTAVCDTVINEGYPGYRKQEVDVHLARAWNWAERNAFIEPSPGINGRNGWRMFTAEGEQVARGACIEAVQTANEFPKALLHNEVVEKCWKLFRTGHYSEAVERSLRIVRDRLRALTGHEKGADAFGKGKLHIKGAIARHVDDDFNEGVKFLTMAIDRFRNEKAHTSENGVDDAVKAFQYLTLSSLALRLLENAEIRP